MSLDAWWAFSESKAPFVPAPRFWRGNFCGVRVPGLPPVDGGANDPSLVLSWFYDRYISGDRAKIRAAWKAKNYTHIVLSWPDSQSEGATPDSFVATVEELIADGFFPCVFWSSKDFDEPDVAYILTNIEPVVARLVGMLPMCCIGWELSLWLTPTQVQQLIDAIAPRFAPSCSVYVHFQEGYSSFQQPGHVFADFWNLNIGKLTGVLHQRVLTQSQNAYWYDSGGLVDILQRFAGNFGVSPDSGFDHPFDLVAMEITAQPQFNGEMTEAQGDDWGTRAIQCPAQDGPAGKVGVMGSGNGCV